MKKALIYFLLTIVSTAYATPTVTSVVARQRRPWNGLVDITVTLSGATSNECAAAMWSFYAIRKTTNGELPIRSVNPVGSVVGSGDVWSRRFVWNAATDVGHAKFGEVLLVVNPSFGVQLWENGPYWAEWNVGATKPEEYGCYFWWGDTVGYVRNAANNGWVSVKDGSAFSFSSGGCPTCGMKNSSLQSAGYVDATGNLVAAHDAATVYLGAPWRMPTDAEMAALVGNCTTTWTTSNGVPGRLVTGKDAYASKSIFLPAAGYGGDSGIYDAGSYGYYWSSTPDSDYSYSAWRLYFGSGDFGRNDYRDRYSGRSVRPVRGFAQ